MSGFGSDVKERRKQCGVTQKALADRTGMPQSIISDIESGKRNPTVRTMTRLASALHCRLVVQMVANDLDCASAMSDGLAFERTDTTDGTPLSASATMRYEGSMQNPTFWKPAPK